MKSLILALMLLFTSVSAMAGPCWFKTRDRIVNLDHVLWIVVRGYTVYLQLEGDRISTEFNSQEDVDAYVKKVMWTSSELCR